MLFRSGEQTYYMGFAIQAPAGVSVTFEYEFYVNFELYGKNIRGMTPSHVDSAGFSAVHSVAQLGNNLLPNEHEPLVLERKMVVDAAHHMRSQQSHVSTVNPLDIVNSGIKLGTTIANNSEAIAGIGSAAWDIGSTLLSFLF